MREINNLTIATTKFIISCEKATQSIIEFTDTIKAIDNRYYPLIRWLHKIGVL